MTAITTVSVHARYLRPDQTTADTGTVTFTPTTALQNISGNQVILPVPVVATLNGTGEFTVSLLALDDAFVSPSGAQYKVEEALGSGRRQYFITLSKDYPSIELADVVPASPGTASFVAVAGATGPAGTTGPTGATGPAGTTLHAGLTDVSSDQHHAKSHVHTGDGSGTVAASSVTFTPAGAVGATQVQAAIQELDTEKSPTTHTHTHASTTSQGVNDHHARDHAAAHAPAGVDDLTSALSAVSVPVALGTASVGSGTGFSRQGHVHPFTGVAQTANNLSDLASATTARSNLGLGTAATAAKVAAGSVGVLDATDPTTTNSRTPTTHTHPESDVTSLVADLAARPPLNVQTFTSAGTFTWTKPTGSFSICSIVLRQATSGGGSGGKAAASTAVSGGGGSPGCGLYRFQCLFSALPASLNVVVGAGGIGGAAVTANSTAGNPGTTGGDTYVGPTAQTALVRSNTTGVGGGGGLGSAGTAGTISAAMFLGGNGGAGSATGAAGGNGTGVNSVGGGGGAAGGGVSALNAFSAGGVGGYGGTQIQVTAPAGGATDGASGTDAAINASVLSILDSGAPGAGGGASSVLGNAGRGGDSLNGSGAGGGGAARDSTGNSGRGGNGSAGFVSFVCW